MTQAAKWTESSRDGQARAGTLDLTHGTVTTPAFMPVGTRASVKSLDSTDLRNCGAGIVLANTYHLMLRPGADVIERMGGLHAFMGWAGPILTDSGGYQIFSLEPTISEQGAGFRSTYDGSEVTLTPEESTRVQMALGPDVAMALDVLVGLPASPEVTRAAMERTLRWEERALEAHNRTDQALFGIVQGGVDPDLRAESARRTADLGFPGFGIGGLSVGESPDDRNRALDVTMAELPPDRVRYVMGLGDSEGVLDAIARGADLFDCVWPTRLARHGRALTRSGDYNLRRAEFAEDSRPIHPECPCHTCATYSRAYLRHLLVTKELSALRLISIHNLHYTLGLMAGAHRAVTNGRFDDFRADVIEVRSRRSIR